MCEEHGQLPLFAAPPVDPRYDPRATEEEGVIRCMGRARSMVEQLQLWERSAAGIVGFAGKPAGPLQAALLRQQDAGRPVSDQQLLLAAARDQGCRVTCRQHRGAAVPTGGGAPLSPASPAEQARARSWAEVLFWREWGDRD